MPKLQKLQGCFEDTPRPFARYAELEFSRCPLTYYSTVGILLLRSVRFGETKLTTAKGAEAWRYLEFLLKLEEKLQ